MTLASTFGAALWAVTGLLVSLGFVLLFAAVALGYGMFVSISALAVEEFSFRRYPRWRDLAAALLAAVAENVCYWQMHAWWRLQGLWRFVRGHDAGWGVMTRTGFTVAPAEEL